MNFDAVLPEIILTLGALVLMMVAAFGGRRSAGFTTWASVALLVGASMQQSIAAVRRQSTLRGFMR